MNYIHNLLIIHRELKPSNILLDHYGQVKIADFGPAVKCFDSHETERYRSIVGTTSYIAPEVIKGDGFQRKSDIWAFGVVCYELLFGVLPFDVFDNNHLDREQTYQRIEYGMDFWLVSFTPR